jgi:hypothetical protein
MTSGTVSLRQETIGVPADMASIITSPNGSMKQKRALGQSQKPKIQNEGESVTSFKSTRAPQDSVGLQ